MNKGSKTYVQYGYDSTGNMTAMVNGLSALMENVNTGTVPEGAARTRYEYDFLNNMTKMIAPDGTEKTYEYDMFGNVTEEGFPDGSISYTYSAMSELLSITGTKGTESKTYTYEYDTLGRRTQASYDGKTISNQYDQIGRLVKETENRGTGNNIVKEYSYDSAHNVETFVLKEGGNTSQSLRYNYDYLNRMVKVSEPGKALTLAEYTYDSNNNLTKESLNNGQYEVQYSYNAANLITGMVNKQLSGSQTLSSYSYTYSLDGNRLSENTKTYSYDAAGRLKAASQNGVQYSYNYDRRGNRSGMQVTANGQSANTSYTYNLNNQLLQESKSIGVDPVSTTWYTYDARGNLLSSTVDEYANAEAGAAAGITGAVLGESETSGAEVYEYDVFGKMEQIQKGNQTIRYGYNADGQRISKTVNSQSTEYIWDGDNIVSEKTGDGPGIYYQRGLGLIASAQGDEYYRDYYFKNAHGDVTGVYYAGNNSQKASYEYDPFGKQIDPNAAGEELLSGSYQGDPNDSNPYRYAGEYYDKETGSIYLRARYYMPSTGRFTQEDPIKDGLNWYAYCGNDPISLVDPFGLKPGDPFLTEQDAAIDFGLEYNAESIEKKQEIGALIYKVEINGDTFYTYTEVVNGKEASVNPWRAWNKNSSIKSGDDITAVIHTHANYDIFSDNAFFSYPNDFETRGRNAYLITPYGEMLFHGNDEEYPQNLQDYLQNRQKYFTNLTVEEGIYMPYDPNAPNKGWSAHDKGLNQTRKYNGYSKNFWKFRLAQKRLAEDAKRRYQDMSISTGMLIY